MDNRFLDYMGLNKYTNNIKTFIISKLSGFVPDSRAINGKALSDDITLSASDVGAIGQSMSGKAVMPFSDTTVTAGINSEIFNDYRIRTYTGGTNNGGNVASGKFSHAEGIGTTSSGESAHAENLLTTASGNNSHSEGQSTIASGNYSHAEGNSTKASSSGSHAEGVHAYATGKYSHAEGQRTTADGEDSHAEGQYSSATAVHSHAEGNTTTADGAASHAEGHHTLCSNFGSHAGGKYNKEMTGGDVYDTTVGDAFVIGNGIEDGARSNALRLAYEGTLYLTKAYKSTGADYAEYFEWLDGNPDNEDRVGHFVTLEGDKLRLAQEGDYVLGVVSGQPCIIGNADEDWLGRWEHDDFNRFIKEYLVHNEVEVIPPTDVVNDEETLNDWILGNEIEERDGHYFKMETEVVDYPTDSWRHKANPNYDASQPYIERQDRKEWDAVGMVGVLSVLDDGTCQVNSYAKVSQDGVATAAQSPVGAYRVIARVTPNIVRIVFSI